MRREKEGNRFKTKKRSPLPIITLSSHFLTLSPSLSLSLSLLSHLDITSAEREEESAHFGSAEVIPHPTGRTPTYFLLRKWELWDQRTRWRYQRRCSILWDVERERSEKREERREKRVMGERADGSVAIFFSLFLILSLSLFFSLCVHLTCSLDRRKFVAIRGMYLIADA